MAVEFDLIKKNASLVLEGKGDELSGVRAIISGYGLDMDDDEVISSDELGPEHPLIKTTMDLTAEILVWCEGSEEDRLDKANLIFSFFELQGAKSEVYTAESEAHFNFWFEEHEKILAELRKLGYNTMICRDDDKSMWVHRAYYDPATCYKDSWIVAHMLPNGVIERMMRTKAPVDSAEYGNWYKCVETQKMMSDRFKRLRAKGLI